MSKLIPLFEQEGFIICFEAHEEDISMRRHFIKECGWTEAQYRKVKNCAWFCAEVSAWKDGKKLGDDYLCACCYETEEEFYTKYRDEGYLPDMVKNAIAEAKVAMTKEAT